MKDGGFRDDKGGLPAGSAAVIAILRGLEQHKHAGQAHYCSDKSPRSLILGPYSIPRIVLFPVAH